MSEATHEGSGFRAVVLAAGLGTRMRSELPKVMHRVLGLPMVTYPVQHALKLGADEVAVVVGHGRALVEAWLSERFAGARVSTHVQHAMNGTADAVRSAHAAFDDFEGSVMILYGDVPNLAEADLESLLRVHRESGGILTFLTAHAQGQTDYGRIVRDGSGRARAIVEFKDCTEAERALTEVNIGLYLVDAAFLRDGLSRLDASNAQGEFYLTDLVKLAYDRGCPAAVVVSDDIEALHGVNNRAQLAGAEAYARSRANRALMLSGVTLRDPATVYVDADVVVERDAELEPGVMLLGRTRVGARARVELGSRLEDVEVEAGAVVSAGTRQVGGRIR
jgi:bifunctional UDP-N-acetylglucosamine pyrophosphorylase/glucosamine-1-phosphate N-acetyltransferase